MQIFSPQVQLFHELDAEGNDEYQMHIVTFADFTNFKESGYQLVSTTPDENNTVKVELFIQEDPDRPRFYCLNPIVHTIDLGPIDFDGDGFIETEIVLQAEVASRTTETNTAKTSKGTTTTSTTSSKKEPRPGKDELQAPTLFD